MKQDASFLLDSAAWPALLVDARGVICLANRAAIQHFGSVLENASATLGAIWAGENSITPEQLLSGPGGEPTAPVPISFRVKEGLAASYLTSVCAFENEGRRMFLLQLLRQSRTGTTAAAGENPQAMKQKLDFAMQLSRTMALDFNNALTGVLGNASLVLGQMDRENPWRRPLLEVERAAERAAEIASDLGNFSRSEKAKVPVGDLAAGSVNVAVQRAVEVVQRIPTADPVTWGVQLEPELFATKADETRIQQAFVKVLENAVEAVRANGHVAVQTRNLELTAPTQDRNVRLPAGAYVCVEVSDNGSGMEADVLPRIFEPFFTTKTSPHRGLGLPFAYGIVTTLGGGVAVSSQPAAGTSVRIYLPAEKRVIRHEAFLKDDLHGKGTVLVVDDEELLLTTSRTILEAYGYKVLTASNGQRALEVLARTETCIDLVVTDFVMPGMNGRELIERIRAQNPALKVLLTSGYVRAPGQTGDSGYLPKPYTAQELLARVKKVLSPTANEGD